MAKRRNTLAASGAAATLLAALALVALVGRASPAQAQIDISGEWNFEVLGFGPGAVPCSASIAQTDAAFTIDAECANVGFGGFTGTIDVETGEFTASGDIAGIPIDLAGTASAGGGSIDGTWDASVIGLSGTLTAERKPPGITPTPLPTLTALADVSGSWLVSFSGIFSGSCDVVIEQDGEALTAVANCSILGTIPLDGTIDLFTGEFSVSGGGITIDGHLLPDGDSFTGTWDAFGFLTGSLMGGRVDAFEFVDVSGGWEVVLIGETVDTCTLTVETELVDASATLDCDTQGSAQLEGIVDPFDGSLRLSGTLNGVDTEFSMGMSDAGDYLFGYQYSFTSDDLYRATIIAVPAGALDRGIILLNCTPDSEFVANRCSYGVSNAENEIELSVNVVAVPEGGYSGLNASLSWPDTLELESASTSCPSGATIVGEGLATMSCTLSSPTESPGEVFALTMTCDPNSESALPLEPGTGFKGVDESLGPPTLVGATVFCYGPRFLEPPPPFGDADCSYEVNSIDASLVLQYEAGLVASLACELQADVNGDGSINSIDATLILQYDAGLVGPADG